MKSARIMFLSWAILMGVSLALWAQKPKDEDKDKGAAPKAEKFYITQDLDEFRRRPEAFQGKDVRLQDHFDAITKLYPRSLQRKGFTPEKYLEFHTSSSNGSNMTCYVPMSEKETVALVNSLSRFAPILLEGSLYGIVNGMPIFIVDHLYSGHEAPRKEGKGPITMIMQWEGDSKKYKYVVSKPGLYVLTDPTTNKKINVEFQY